MTISATTQGLRPGVCTSTSRPSTPFDGMVIYETDTNTLAVYDGSGWVSLNPVDRDRNVIINGGFDIWQRGTSSTATGNTYLADRWMRAVQTGGTQSQETSDLPSGQGFRYAWKHAATATNTFMQMGQQIEFVNCKRLQGRAVTISFWAKALNSNSGSTSLTVRTRTASTVDATAIFSGTNTDSSVTLSTSWVRYSVTRTLASSFGALSLEFVLGSHVSGDGFLITGIQMEAGAVATPFEFEDYGTTLAKCQRYYRRFTATATFSKFPMYGAAVSSTSVQGPITLVPSMRTNPTSIESSGSFRVQDAGNVFAVTSFSVIAGTELATNDLVVIGAAVASGLTTSRPYHLTANDSSSAYIGFSAEF